MKAQFGFSLLLIVKYERVETFEKRIVKKKETTVQYLGNSQPTQFQKMRKFALDRTPRVLLANHLPNTLVL